MSGPSIPPNVLEKVDVGLSIPPYILEKVDVRIQKNFILFGRGRSFVLVNLGAD